MEALYGEYPMRITCQCNAVEMKVEAHTFYLNDRCPICNKPHQVCAPLPEIRMKAVEPMERERELAFA